MISFSRSLVISQLGSAALLLLSSPLLADRWIAMLIQLAGLAIGIWAIAVMRSTNQFSIPPDVPDGSRLVKRSIYKYIRHPMYTAVLLYFLPSLLVYFSWWRLGYFAVLLVTLLVKIDHEERLLKGAFADYVDYQKQSWHLLPFVY